MELQVPCVGGLFETIYRFFKFAHFILLLHSSDNETLWLLHVDLLIKHTIEGCQFDVHLVYVPVF